MSETQSAGLGPRTETDVPLSNKADATLCDICGTNKAEGVMPDGRSVCAPCARREPVLITDGGEDVPDDVDEEFVARLNSIEQAIDRVEELQDAVERLDIGLSEEDTERLLWARMSGWSLTDVRGAFDAVDDVQGRNSRDLTIRMLAQLGNMTQDEADEFLDECERLREKYSDEGDLVTDGGLDAREVEERERLKPVAARAVERHDTRHLEPAHVHLEDDEKYAVDHVDVRDHAYRCVNFKDAGEVEEVIDIPHHRVVQVEWYPAKTAIESSPFDDSDPFADPGGEDDE